MDEEKSLGTMSRYVELCIDWGTDMMRKILSALLAVFALTGTALGQSNYPVKPVNIVISFGLGGGTDLLARFLAQAMEATLGQPIVVLKTPRAAIEKLNAATRKAVTDPTVIKRFLDAGIYPSASAPEHLAELIGSDTRRWSRVIKASGFTIE